MKSCLYLFGFILMTAAACNPRPELSARRFGMVTGLRPEQVNTYKDLHAHAWPAVLAKIKSCHIRNYSIYLKEIDHRFYLFSYFEYDGKNFEADMKSMAADKITRLWWQKTDPTQLPLPDAAEKKQIWSNMDEVFHAD